MENTSLQTLTSIKEKLLLLKPELIEKYRVKKNGILGSFANRTFTKESDVDILIEFEVTPVWKFFRMNFLENYFQRKVDLVTPDAIKPQTKDRILNQVIYI